MPKLNWMDKRWRIFRVNSDNTWQPLRELAYHECVPQSPVGCELIASYMNVYGAQNIRVVEVLHFDTKIICEPLIDEGQSRE